MRCLLTSRILLRRIKQNLQDIRKTKMSVVTKWSTSERGKYQETKLKVK